MAVKDVMSGSFVSRTRKIELDSKNVLSDEITYSWWIPNRNI